jgi:hypothetical protein
MNPSIANQLAIVLWNRSSVGFYRQEWFNN